jgi:predicted membrane GTPase involved in stress response
MRGSACVLEGGIPAARVHELQQRMSALTRGEGVLKCAFDHHEPVHGTVPARERSDTIRSIARSTCGMWCAASSPNAGWLGLAGK